MATEVHTQKVPKATEFNWYQFYPSWRITILQTVDPFGWHEIDTETLLYIKQKLQHFETMTLAQIFVEGQKFNHGVSVFKLCSEAKKRLRELGLDDIDELHTLRLEGKKRIWGLLRCNVFSFIWWDPLHLVCPYTKPGS